MKKLIFVLFFLALSLQSCASMAGYATIEGVCSDDEDINISIDIPKEMVYTRDGNTWLIYNNEDDFNEFTWSLSISIRKDKYDPDIDKLIKSLLENSGIKYEYELLYSHIAKINPDIEDVTYYLTLFENKNCYIDTMVYSDTISENKAETIVKSIKIK